MIVCRSLTMEGLDTLLNDSLLPESFSTMTKLTYLEMRGITTASVAPVMALPGLSSLTLWLSEQDLQPRNLGLQSTALTYLGVWRAKMQSVSQETPHVLPARFGASDHLLYQFVSLGQGLPD